MGLTCTARRTLGRDAAIASSAIGISTACGSKTRTVGTTGTIATIGIVLAAITALALTRDTTLSITAFDGIRARLTAHTTRIDAALTRAALPAVGAWARSTSAARGIATLSGKTVVVIATIALQTASIHATFSGRTLVGTRAIATVGTLPINTAGAGSTIGIGTARGRFASTVDTAGSSPTLPGPSARFTESTRSIIATLPLSALTGIRAALTGHTLGILATAAGTAIAVGRTRALSARPSLGVAALTGKTIVIGATIAGNTAAVHTTFAVCAFRTTRTSRARGALSFHATRAGATVRIRTTRGDLAKTVHTTSAGPTVRSSLAGRTALTIASGATLSFSAFRRCGAALAGHAIRVYTTLSSHAFGARCTGTITASPRVGVTALAGETIRRVAALRRHTIGLFYTRVVLALILALVLALVLTRSGIRIRGAATPQGHQEEKNRREGRQRARSNSTLDRPDGHTPERSRGTVKMRHLHTSLTKASLP